MVPHLIMLFTCLVILNSIWWLKRQIIGIPHHDCSTNNLWDGTMWKCGNLCKHAIIFSYLERTTKGCVKAQNAIANFLLWWHKWNIFSFLPHHAKWISYKACTPHHAWALTICVVLHEFQSLGVCLEPLLQMYAHHYSLQSKCNLAISSHHFPFIVVQHSHKYACCQ
jgi:hypothetical protein